LYVNCPVKRELKAYCESCKRLGHWAFCCWSTLDSRDDPSSSTSHNNIGMGANDSKVKAYSSELMASILERIDGNGPVNTGV
jgi:hypothetical protein